jgi:hypothetical protein
MDDVFAVQEEIARTVVAALRVTLTAPAVLAPDRPADVAAYTLYLRGRHHWNRRTQESITRSIEYYRQALERDPQYAQAYAGLAAVYADISSVSLPPSEAMPKAKAAVLKAVRRLRIDGVLTGRRCDWSWNEGEAT